MHPDDKIPVSVIVATKNEERNITRCLTPLSVFSEVLVVDSQSTDRTKFLATEQGARVIDFVWNGQYPKKRQWILDNINLQHDWVFFVDADELVTPELIREIQDAFNASVSCDGYFVRGLYVWQGQLLRHGLSNNKLCLFNRRKIEFPVVDDLGLPGMGEIEGHYQPVLKSNGRIGHLRQAVLHYAAEDKDAWLRRHERYAAWENGMNRRNAWPRDPDPQRQMMKQLFRNLPLRGAIAFVHSYVLKKGFLDGAAGFDFALSRYHYYRMISLY